MCLASCCRLLAVEEEETTPGSVVVKVSLVVPFSIVVYISSAAGRLGRFVVSSFRRFSRRPCVSVARFFLVSKKEKVVFLMKNEQNFAKFLLEFFKK